MNNLPAVRDIPLLRQTRKLHQRFNFQEFTTRYLQLLFFSVCILVAGVLTGHQQGAKPLFISQKEAVRLAEMEKNFVAVESSIAADFKPAVALADFRITRMGETIEIHFGSSGVFVSGQADLSQRVEADFKQLAGSIFKIKKDFRIAVEGYTDDSPMLPGSSRFPTNWELSGARAARILRVFNQAGFPIGNLTFVGHGETRPLVPNRDDKGRTLEANRMRNRRIVIRLSSI